MTNLFSFIPTCRKINLNSLHAHSSVILHNCKLYEAMKNKRGISSGSVIRFLVTLLRVLFFLWHVFHLNRKERIERIANRMWFQNLKPTFINGPIYSVFIFNLLWDIALFCVLIVWQYIDRIIFTLTKAINARFYLNSNHLTNN